MVASKVTKYDFNSSIVLRRSIKYTKLHIKYKTAQNQNSVKLSVFVKQGYITLQQKISPFSKGKDFDLFDPVVVQLSFSVSP